MTTILRDLSAVSTASMADLLATYAALTGQTVKRFSDRTTAERRVTDAIMAAKDARGHLGVAPGSTPSPATVSERVDIAQAKGLDPAAQLPEAGAAPAPGVEVEEGACPYLPGSLAAQLWAATRAAKKPEPRPKPAPRDPSAPKRAPVGWVKATGTGKSKPQPGSDRNAVLVYVTNAKGDDGQQRPVSLVELEAHFQKPCRGFIQKLIEVEHLVACEAPAAQA